jgi:hypothetical protein
VPTSENKLNTRKPDKTGGYCGSTDLPVVVPERSEREIFCGNVAMATKNKKSEEGRHVGLDFYDLLIEARILRILRRDRQLELPHWIGGKSE